MPAKLTLLGAVALTALAGSTLAAEDKIELDTTRIITNEELPGLIYLVPWKDTEAVRVEKQKLVLHDFFGELYDPILPDSATGAP